MAGDRFAALVVEILPDWRHLTLPETARMMDILTPGSMLRLRAGMELHAFLYYRTAVPKPVELARPNTVR